MKELMFTVPHYYKYLHRASSKINKLKTMVC